MRYYSTLRNSQYALVVTKIPSVNIKLYYLIFIDQYYKAQVQQFKLLCENLTVIGSSHAFSLLQMQGKAAYNRATQQDPSFPKHCT